jgi:hypothetical protein
MRPAASSLYPWYDSQWLAKYTEAKATLHGTRPQLAREFETALLPLRTRPDFRVVRLDRIFDAITLDEIRRAATRLRPGDLKLHESRDFGRFVVHDHPFFCDLQKRVEPLVSDVVGEPVETAYNFLSLYGRRGVCALHLDSPESKWTLDLCLAQSLPWPIYFSQVVPWPEVHAGAALGCDWAEQIRHDSSLTFEACTLDPGEAVIFSGSSQWHYREPIPPVPNAFCNLLFFHFLPSGMSEIVRPANWARLFGASELAALA